MNSFPVDACASLGKFSYDLIGDCFNKPLPGINVVSDLDPNVTHHLSPTFHVSSSIAHSLLLAAQIVTWEWLREIVHLGELNGGGTSGGISLEQSFALPPVMTFHPSFPPSLPTALRKLEVWEPNEERLNMFAGHIFLFVGEKGREVKADLKEVVLRGGGEYEGFDVNGGRRKWQQLLAKGQRRVSQMPQNRKGLVLISSHEDMTLAVGKDIWKEFTDEAEKYSTFIPFLALRLIKYS